MVKLKTRGRRQRRTKIYDPRLQVMKNQSLSPEQELTQDGLTILHSFSIRLYGLRNSRKTLKEA